LCGHSYGGMVVTAAGAHPAVSHVVYITAVVPDEGETMASLSGPEPAPWMDFGEDGTVGVLVDPVLEYFAYDLDESTTAGAVERLTRMSARPFGEAPAALAWKTKPSTYVVCTEDHAIPVAAQRQFAARTAASVDVPTGHFPFLTQPDVLAAVLADIASEG
jgi:pimeloyl-ACP methyl ester carboxylesterase